MCIDSFLIWLQMYAFTKKSGRNLYSRMMPLNFIEADSRFCVFVREEPLEELSPKISGKHLLHSISFMGV